VLALCNDSYTQAEIFHKTKTSSDDHIPHLPIPPTTYNNPEESS